MHVARHALTFLLLSAVCCAGVAQAQNKPADAKLSDIAFISGQWEGPMEGGRIEEHWSVPSGDSMMGMFKWLKDGKTAMYEFLSIEMESTGPVLKLKHFNRGLLGWEEKTKVWEYPLVEVSPGEARFQSADKQTTLIYKQLGPDKLLAVLERVKDGKTTREEFPYTRAK